MDNALCHQNFFFASALGWQGRVRGPKKPAVFQSPSLYRWPNWPLKTCPNLHHSQGGPLNLPHKFNLYLIYHFIFISGLSKTCVPCLPEKSFDWSLFNSKQSRVGINHPILSKCRSRRRRDLWKWLEAIIFKRQRSLFAAHQRKGKISDPTKLLL